MEKELMLVALRFALLANYAQRSGRAGRSGEAAMRIDTDEWFRPKSAARFLPRARGYPAIEFE